MTKLKPSFLKYGQAFKIAAGYALVGFIWILFSDQVVEFLIKDVDMLKRAQTLKGSFFVGVTGIFLFLFLMVQFRAINETNRALSVKNEELNERNGFIDQIYNGLNGIIMVWSLDGQIIETNRFFNELLGYTAEELIGASWKDLFLPPEDRGTFQLTVSALKKTGAINNYENDILTKSGQKRRILWNDRIMNSALQETPIVISFGVDISESVEKDLEINRLLYFDKLTGAPNAVQLELDCRAKIMRHAAFTMMLINIQQLSKINSRFGVGTGDKLVSYTYDYLKAFYKESQVYKWNDGTFLILTDEMNRDELKKQVELLLSRFSERQVIDGKEFITGLGIGLVHYPVNSVSFEDLIHYVSYASASAKSAGHHKYKFFTEQMLDELNQSIEAETKLKDALVNDTLELFLQPLYNLQQNKPDSVEVLLRCMAEDFYFESIQDFIKIAERTGQIVDVDFWVIRKVFELCATNPVIADLDVGINLSAQTFTSIRFIPFIESLLAAYPIQSRKIVFELTEHTVVDDFDAAGKIIKALKKLGFSIALDDFGSEYSSLKYISKLTFDTIKIDKTFVDELVESDADREIVEGIIRLGERLQVRVVAEGVETLEQMKLLREMGCHYVQGYLIAKPQRISSVLEYLGTYQIDVIR